MYNECQTCCHVLGVIALPVKFLKMVAAERCLRNMGNLVLVVKHVLRTICVSTGRALATMAKYLRTVFVLRRPLKDKAPKYTVISAPVYGNEV